jgi:hypothetical protein
MRVIFVNRPLQNADTENPQLIDGEYPEWCVKEERTKIGQTMLDFLQEKWADVKSKPSGEHVEGFYIHNVQPISGIINTDWSTGNAALVIRFDYILTK